MCAMTEHTIYIIKFFYILSLVSVIHVLCFDESYQLAVTVGPDVIHTCMC